MTTPTPDYSKALLLSDAAVCLLEHTQKRPADDELLPDALAAIAAGLRDAAETILPTERATVPEFWIENESIRVALAVAGTSFPSTQPLTWSKAKELVRAGILAGIQLSRRAVVEPERITAGGES